MKRSTTLLTLFATMSCLTIAPLSSLAQDQPLRSAPKKAVKQPTKQMTRSMDHPSPVNDMCPIGKEPIVEGVPTSTYKGKAIGFCCANCNKEFSAWDEHAKDQFVVLAVAHNEPGQQHVSQPAAKPVDGSIRVGDPYLLTTCPVGGGELGSMGDAIVEVFDGREVRFCCAMCVPKFEADPEKYWAAIDAEIIEAQLPYYPITTCVVSDEDLGDPADKQIDVVYNNRLVRLCCKRCNKRFRTDPEQYLSAIDEAIIAQQRDAYPMNTCIVTGDELVEEDIIEKIVGNRLFRLCCKGCKRELKKNPTEFVAKLDAAWSAHGGVRH